LSQQRSQHVSSSNLKLYCRNPPKQKMTFEKDTALYLRRQKLRKHRSESIRCYIVTLLYTLLFLVFTALSYSTVGSQFELYHNVILDMTLTSFKDPIFKILNSLFIGITFSDSSFLSPYCLLPRFCQRKLSTRVLTGTCVRTCYLS
jgi:hypothetical protein